MPKIFAIPELQGFTVRCKDQTGVFLGINVQCNCCDKEFSPSQWERHCGSTRQRPWQTIIVVGTNLPLQFYKTRLYPPPPLELVQREIALKTMSKTVLVSPTCSDDPSSSLSLVKSNVLKTVDLPPVDCSFKSLFSQTPLLRLPTPPLLLSPKQDLPDLSLKLPPLINLKDESSFSSFSSFSLPSLSSPSSKETLFKRSEVFSQRIQQDEIPPLKRFKEEKLDSPLSGLESPPLSPSRLVDLDEEDDLRALLFLSQMKQAKFSN